MTGTPISRSSFILGIAAALVLMVMLGMAGSTTSEHATIGGSYHISQSADGRTVYLWETGGGQISFVDSASAKGGRGQGKNDDMDDDDDARGKGKRKDKDRDDDDDDDDDDNGKGKEKSKGKGKGRGGN